MYKLLSKHFDKAFNFNHDSYVAPLTLGSKALMNTHNKFIFSKLNIAIYKT